MFLKLFGLFIVTLMTVVIRCNDIADTAKLMLDQMTAYAQQAVTATTDVPIAANPKTHSHLICPKGYALANLYPDDQTKTSWFKQIVEYDFPVRDFPHIRYICHKIEDQWVSTTITGSRG